MMKCSVLLLIILTVGDVGTASAVYRIWEGRNGSLVEAELVYKTDETVVLLKRDGNKATVPISMLSDSDQNYLRGDGGEGNEHDPSIEEQLKRLKSMYADGLITTAVYEKMQQELVGEMLDGRGDATGQPVDLKDGLVLYFSFNKPASFKTIKDESGNGNDGKVQKATWVEDGWIGGAYYFDPESRTQRIRVADSDSLDCRSITLSVWIKTEDPGTGWNRIFDKDWRQGYCLTMCASMPEDPAIGDRWLGMVSLDMENKCWLPSNRQVNDGTWHHIVATYGDGFKRIYVDGKIGNEERMPEYLPISVNDYDLVIGNCQPAHDRISGEQRNSFEGYLDEIRIYNRALNPHEVSALFALRE